jgi:excisionase family DNA binding protein
MADAVIREVPMTVGDVARELNVSAVTVRRWVAAGDLEALRLGRSASAHYRIERSAVEEFVRPASEKRP